VIFLKYKTKYGDGYPEKKLFVLGGLQLKSFMYFCSRINNPKFLQIMAYKIDADVCSACGSCQGECPQEAINEGSVYSIDPELCIDCGACADACPMEAIHPE
jgi:NAD-dependent dihydropyrimidine dehydrogenase PreA subunit